MLDHFRNKEMEKSVPCSFIHLTKKEKTEGLLVWKGHQAVGSHPEEP